MFQINVSQTLINKVTVCMSQKSFLIFLETKMQNLGLIFKMSAKPHGCVLLRRTHQIFSRRATLLLHNSLVCLCIAGGERDVAGICVGP